MFWKNEHSRFTLSYGLARRGPRSSLLSSFHLKYRLPDCEIHMNFPIRMAYESRSVFQISTYALITFTALDAPGCVESRARSWNIMSLYWRVSLVEVDKPRSTTK